MQISIFPLIKIETLISYFIYLNLIYHKLLELFNQTVLMSKRTNINDLIELFEEFYIHGLRATYRDLNDENIECDNFYSKWENVKHTIPNPDDEIEWRPSAEKYYDELMKCGVIDPNTKPMPLPGQGDIDIAHIAHISKHHTPLFNIGRIIKDNPSGTVISLMEIAFNIGLICRDEIRIHYRYSVYSKQIRDFFWDNNLNWIEGYIVVNKVGYNLINDLISNTSSDSNPNQDTSIPIISNSYFLLTSNVIGHWMREFAEVFIYGRNVGMWGNNSVTYWEDVKSHILHIPIKWNPKCEKFYYSLRRLCLADEDINGDININITIKPELWKSTPRHFLLELGRIVKDNPYPTYDLLLEIAYNIGLVEAEIEKEDGKLSWKRHSIDKDLTIFTGEMREFYWNNKLYDIETYLDFNIIPNRNVWEIQRHYDCMFSKMDHKLSIPAQSPADIISKLNKF